MMAIRPFSICLIFNNIEGKITECWLVNEEGIFFCSFCLWREQNYLLTIGPRVADSCNNDVSFRDSWRGIYRIKRQERKWKHEVKDRVLEELSQKGGEWKKFQENLEEYANDVLDQRLSQF